MRYAGSFAPGWSSSRTVISLVASSCAKKSPKTQKARSFFRRSGPDSSADDSATYSPTFGCGSNSRNSEFSKS